LVCIYGYKTLDEAIEQANSLDVSFQAAVFSDNVQRAMEVAEKLEAQRVPGASFDLRLQPTLAEPIKLKNATRGSVTNFSAFSLFCCHWASSW
jgi:hypothetical protein